MSLLKKSLTFSNAVALLALFIALGGTVYAASGKIDGSQVKVKSLPANRLQPKSIGAAQIKSGAIGAGQIKSGAIGAAQIKAGAVSAQQIQAKSITGAQIGPSSITGTQILPGSLGATQINQASLTGISAANIHTVQYVTSTVTLVANAVSGTSGTAGCPTGTKVIGGGAATNNSKLGFIFESAPTADRNGWTANALSEGPGVSMTVTAICTAVAAPAG